MLIVMEYQREDNLARAILNQWASLKGHERCWHYPEFIGPLAGIYGLSLEGVILDPETREVFDKGCERFR